ncbi:MAG: hypothetical protein QOF55_1661 [Thermoleophilaceae bacterium]|nr:hypothetical protein [Thermoleophilaceae bacterium]
MRQASPTFAVETFEYVHASPELALLRLAGTWRAGNPAGDVGLAAWIDGERIGLSPLPAPPSEGDSWRAAYSASPELLSDPPATFELEPPAGPPIPLPAPVEHGAAVAEAPREEPHRFFSRRRAHEPSAPEPEPVPASSGEPPELDQTVAELRARAERAEALVSRELRSTVGKTEELIRRIDGYEHLREELDAARAELAAARAEIDAAEDHLDTVHDAHSLELRAARAQRDAAEERRAALERELGDAHAEIEALRAHIEDRESLIERARAEAAQASEESADLHAAVARLRDAIAVRARDAAEARRRFARSPEEIDRSREELRRDAERIAALELQAEALRDAIHSQLPYSLHASPLQEALPLAEDDDGQPAEGA